MYEKVLLQQQKNEIEETVSKAQMEHIKLCANENEISLTELDDILQPIIDSCTKDSIANGRWLLLL
jgi:calcium homeostasis ER protein